ncbi:MAG: hypothetical protein ABIK07_09880 [Planctomycetota bacterium]
MEFNTILLLAFVLLMVFCCGGMMMRMGGGKNKPRDNAKESDASIDEANSQDR